MRYTSLTGICLLLLAAMAGAQPQAERLTVAQAVQIALQNHPLLQVSAYELQAAQAQWRGAKARANPEVRLAPAVLGSEGSDELLSVFQPLELNGARRARAQIAGGQLAETQAGSRLTRDELVLQVAQAYWEAALARQTHEFDLENVKYARTVAEAANTQFELGNQPQVQAQKAEVEVARATLQLLQSEAAATQAVARLNAWLGRAPEAPLTLADEPSEVAPPLAAEELQARAQAQRPEILQAQAAVRTAQGEVAAARAARRTDVALQARLTPEGLGGVGVSLDFPQLDWGGLKAEQQRAEAIVKAREKTLEVARNQVRLEVAQALTALTSAQAQTREYQQRVMEQSRKLADLALLGYREGASSFLEVLDARRTLRVVNVEYYSAVAQQLKMLAALERATGGEVARTSDSPSQPAEVK